MPPEGILLIVMVVAWKLINLILYNNMEPSMGEGGGYIMVRGGEVLVGLYSGVD